MEMSQRLLLVTAVTSWNHHSTQAGKCVGITVVEPPNPLEEDTVATITMKKIKENHVNNNM